MSESKNKKPVSSSKERAVFAYLRPSIYAKFEKYIERHGGSKSEAINEAIRRMVEPMSPQEKISPK